MHFANTLTRWSGRSMCSTHRLLATPVPPYELFTDFRQQHAEMPAGARASPASSWLRRASAEEHRHQSRPSGVSGSKACEMSAAVHHTDPLVSRRPAHPTLHYPRTPHRISSRMTTDAPGSSTRPPSTTTPGSELSKTPSTDRSSQMPEGASARFSRSRRCSREYRSGAQYPECGSTVRLSGQDPC